MKKIPKWAVKILIIIPLLSVIVTFVYLLFELIKGTIFTEKSKILRMTFFIILFGYISLTGYYTWKKAKITKTIKSFEMKPISKAGYVTLLFLSALFLIITIAETLWYMLSGIRIPVLEFLWPALSFMLTVTFCIGSSKWLLTKSTDTKELKVSCKKSKEE